MNSPQTWRDKVGHQRDWVWRGWQTRYTYLRPSRKQGGDPLTPLIFLHGFGAAIGHWRHNLPAFSQHYPVYALDLLGFGASEKASANYVIPLWLEQVHDFWQTFIQTPVVLVGNSIGSQVCLAVAAAYPQMVRGLVMLNLPDASVLEAPDWARPVITTLIRLLSPPLALTKQLLTVPILFSPFFRTIRRPSIIRVWAQQAYADSSRVDPELVEILSSPAYDYGAAEALRAMINARSEQPSYAAKDILPHLNLPMLLIWGRQDQMVPPKLGPLLARRNLNLQLLELDNAGHCPHDECPDRINQVVLDWLQVQF